MHSRSSRARRADVVQKLQPIGQPTDGTIVADAAAASAGAGQPHDAKSERRGYRPVSDRTFRSFTQEGAHPRHPLPADDVVGVDHRLQSRRGGHVAADDDGRPGCIAPHEPAHLADLPGVHDDRRDAHDVVVAGDQLADEALARREVEQVQGAEML
jgi:hypothetical protein